MRNQTHELMTVVPAKAGTHRLWNMGPRFRGNDGGAK
jgi:hypothetical protein